MRLGAVTGTGSVARVSRDNGAEDARSARQRDILKTLQQTRQVDVTALAARVMTFSEAALFEFGKADLKPEGKEQISAYREQAREALGRADQVMITGYTDNVGEEADNFALSLQRAEAVRDHLVTLGADADKFLVSGAGEANPVADNTTDEGRAQNRRVEVAVAGVEKPRL